jgi:magnesium chelatase family protein
VLESLREPLETGRVAVARVGAQAEYPASFQLVAAMNPCPCGYQRLDGAPCRCKAPVVERYRSRLSGPLLDRLDLRVELDAVSNADLAEHRRAASAAAGSTASAGDEAVRARILSARNRQRNRQGCLQRRPWRRATGRRSAVLGDAAQRALLRMREAQGTSLRALRPDGARGAHARRPAWQHGNQRAGRSPTP